MTKSQFQERWDAVLWDIGRHRYTPFLEEYRVMIESRVAWVPEEYAPPKKVEVGPKQSESKTSNTKIKLSKPQKDGYEMLRSKKPIKLNWKNTR